TGRHAPWYWPGCGSVTRVNRRRGCDAAWRTYGWDPSWRRKLTDRWLQDERRGGDRTAGGGRACGGRFRRPRGGVPRGRFDCEQRFWRAAPDGGRGFVGASFRQARQTTGRKA